MNDTDQYYTLGYYRGPDATSRQLPDGREVGAYWSVEHRRWEVLEIWQGRGLSVRHGVSYDRWAAELLADGVWSVLMDELTVAVAR